MSNLILRCAICILFPLIVLMALFSVENGVHGTGGGFAGALLVTIGIFTVLIIPIHPNILKQLTQRVFYLPRLLIGLGLVFFSVTGVLKFLVLPYWTSMRSSAPVLVKMQTHVAVIFDWFLFISVSGSLLLVLLSFWEEFE